MHDNRQAWNLVADFLDHIEVQSLFASKFIGAVTGADRRSQRIAPGLFYKLDGLVRIRKAGMSFVHFDVFFDPTQHSQLRFDADTLRVGALNYALGDGHVFSKRLVTRVNHHRTVKARVDAIIAGLLIAVIELDGENCVGYNILLGPRGSLEPAVAGRTRPTLGQLD